MNLSKGDPNYCLDFATKIGPEEKTFKLWIYNISNSKFKNIIDGKQI